MSLTPEQIDLIQESFADIAKAPGDAAAVFYATLFERAPQVRKLFVEDMERQGRKLINTLGVVVSQLDSLDAMLPVLEDLALRHTAYGVRPEDYTPVADALSTMIQTCCRSMPDQDCTAAWMTAYTDLADTMISLGYPYDDQKGVS